MNIKYCGPALDYSGYGEANRHDIGALISAGYNVIGDYTRHCLEIGEFGDLGELVMACSRNTGDYDIKIIHTTPNIYGQFIEPEKYHIGRIFWETDKLPEQFANGANMVDEIWTGGQFNAKAIRNAGVKGKEIIIVPEAIAEPKEIPEPYILPYDRTFKFYSIFEWTERKDPKSLLTAYFTEFQNGENVSLTVKTYLDNFTTEKQQEVRNLVLKIKRDLGLAKYPPLFLYTKLFSRKEVYKFHNSFDCYVSSHRGEGWGIPQMEAMILGRPVISTDIGGIHEYIGDVAMLIPCTMVRVSNNRNTAWYCDDQKWGQVDIRSLRQAMRWCYENQNKAKAMGSKARDFVRDNFSLEAVGKIMDKRLKKIKKMLLTNKSKGL